MCLYRKSILHNFRLSYLSSINLSLNNSQQQTPHSLLYEHKSNLDAVNTKVIKII